jgi:hypothetical protein
VGLFVEASHTSHRDSWVSRVESERGGAGGVGRGGWAQEKLRRLKKAQVGALIAEELAAQVDAIVSAASDEVTALLLQDLLECGGEAVRAQAAVAKARAGAQAEADLKREQMKMKMEKQEVAAAAAAAAAEAVARGEAKQHINPPGH